MTDPATARRLVSAAFRFSSPDARGSRPKPSDRSQVRSGDVATRS